MSHNARHLNSLLDALPLGVQENDLNGVITYSNLAQHKILGYENGELIGKTIYDFQVHEKDKKELRDYLAYLIAEQPKLEPCITTIRRKDGSQINIKVDWSYIHDNAGTLTGFASVMSDHSEYLLQEKTRLSEQLCKKQRMEALTHLTGGMAHDFNNILASILGYADLTLESLKETGNQNELVRYIGEVIDEGEKARDLIKQMLAFTRTDPNKDIALNPAPLIKEIAKVIQASLPDSIDFSINTDPDIPKALIDPSRLSQAILDICANARDALAGMNGHISINISQATCHQTKCQSCQEYFDGEFIEISVTDNGKGIEPLVLEGIFGKTTKTNGTGLASTNDFLHEHHGHIIVESIINYGTAVRLLLPIAPHDKLPTSQQGINKGQ